MCSILYAVAFSCAPHHDENSLAKKSPNLYLEGERGTSNNAHAQLIAEPSLSQQFLSSKSALKAISNLFTNTLAELCGSMDLSESQEFQTILAEV